jgi:uncharacterized protein YdiU (UPF0061 family)
MSMLNLEYTYLNLPASFYSYTKPLRFQSPQLLIENEALLANLNIPQAYLTALISLDTDLKSVELSRAFSQAYAGHQFGHFTMLGDGRALVIGEIVKDTERYDLQLKGSGPSAYARRGDGKATAKAMLREYLISEAMHGLKIPTSRSIGVVATGETMMRERQEPAAVLGRIMKSHLRVGTFEYARYFLTTKDLEALLHYAVDRLYPPCRAAENMAIEFIVSVANNQFKLIADWMRVGFIHGVMNTDNTALSGETFDYGPCAFMNQYHPKTVFSSIDTQGRYAFEQQGNIIQWNLVRLTEALLPLIEPDESRAIARAKTLIQSFDQEWTEIYNLSMAKKIGFNVADSTSKSLIAELLALMQLHAVDYTNTFAGLSHVLPDSINPWNIPAFSTWRKSWNQSAEAQGYAMEDRLQCMAAVNPVVIPRNHIVESLLSETSQWDANPEKKQRFQEALNIWSNPYFFDANLISWMTPPTHEDNIGHQTFCGT